MVRHRWVWILDQVWNDGLMCPQLRFRYDKNSAKRSMASVRFSCELANEILM